MSEQTKKLLSTLGLCARARKLVIGTPMVCERLRSDSERAGTEQRVYAVIEASDTSDNTHAKLTSKCNFYGVPHYRLDIGAVELAHAVGKTGATAAVGILDSQLMRAVAVHLPSDENH
ncbi:MAG: ribosomal L7Ae/L30e/S12e/Gadd45 family protein [Clostridia bacterium]|nr:ribosomal L7Ae/L30e/S12e/Gadd45 family protein [Clostridia bacterium]